MVIARPGGLITILAERLDLSMNKVHVKAMLRSVIVHLLPKHESYLPELLQLS